MGVVGVEVGQEVGLAVACPPVHRDQALFHSTPRSFSGWKSCRRDVDGETESQREFLLYWRRDGYFQILEFRSGWEFIAGCRVVREGMWQVDGHMDQKSTEVDGRAHFFCFWFTYLHIVLINPLLYFPSFFK